RPALQFGQPRPDVCGLIVPPAVDRVLVAYLVFSMGQRRVDAPEPIQLPSGGGDPGIELGQPRTIGEPPPTRFRMLRVQSEERPAHGVSVATRFGVKVRTLGARGLKKVGRSEQVDALSDNRRG